MAIFIGVLWAIAVFAAMYWTRKVYVLYLERFENCAKVKSSTLDCMNANSETIRGIRTIFFTRKKHRVFMLLVLIAVGCAGYNGFVTYSISSNWISLFKLTAANIVLAIASVTDLDLMIIPNQLSIILIVIRIVTIILEFLFYPEIAAGLLINSLIALFSSLLIFLLLSIITRRAMGMGDIKIFISLGLLLGVKALSAIIVFSLFIAAILSIILLLSKKKSRKDVIPMGPCTYFGLGLAIVLNIF